MVSAVDAGGALIYLHRPDDAQVASVEVTTDKARTAAIYRRPSKDFEDQASNGRPSALHLARAVPLQGGEPIEFDGMVIGAVGVSGATSADEDRELALIGARAGPRRRRSDGHRHGHAGRAPARTAGAPPGQAGRHDRPPERRPAWSWPAASGATAMRTWRRSTSWRSAIPTIRSGPGSRPTAPTT